MGPTPLSATPYGFSPSIRLGKTDGSFLTSSSNDSYTKFIKRALCKLLYLIQMSIVQIKKCVLSAVVHSKIICCDQKYRKRWWMLAHLNVFGCIMSFKFLFTPVLKITSGKFKVFFKDNLTFMNEVSAAHDSPR